MICVETIGKIRRWRRVDKLSISEIARRLGASRNTVANYLEGDVTRPKYKTRPKRSPVMGAWAGVLEAMLLEMPLGRGKRSAPPSVCMMRWYGPDLAGQVQRIGIPTVSRVAGGLKAGVGLACGGLGKCSGDVPGGSQLWGSAMTGGAATRSSPMWRRFLPRAWRGIRSSGYAPAGSSGITNGLACS